MVHPWLVIDNCSSFQIRHDAAFCQCWQNGRHRSQLWRIHCLDDVGGKAFRSFGLRSCSLASRGLEILWYCHHLSLASAAAYLTFYGRLPQWIQFFFRGAKWIEYKNSTTTCFCFQNLHIVSGTWVCHCPRKISEATKNQAWSIAASGSEAKSFFSRMEWLTEMFTFKIVWFSPKLLCRIIFRSSNT